MGEGVGQGIRRCLRMALVLRGGPSLKHLGVGWAKDRAGT